MKCLIKKSQKKKLISLLNCSKQVSRNLHEIYVPIAIYVVIPIVLIFLEMYEATFVFVILVSFLTANKQK